MKLEMENIIYMGNFIHFLMPVGDEAKRTF
jgi:hypothetical protein